MIEVSNTVNPQPESTRATALRATLPHSRSAPVCAAIVLGCDTVSGPQGMCLRGVRAATVSPTATTTGKDLTMSELMKVVWGYGPSRRVFVLSFFDEETRLRGFDEVRRQEGEGFVEAYGRAYDSAERWCLDRGFTFGGFAHLGGPTDED